jgi:hypothetical protein
LELRPLRKKNINAASYLRNIFIFSFVGIIGVSAFFLGNYLSTTKETTQLSEASEIIRCGYVENICVKLDPGVFGTSTNPLTNRVCKQGENSDCVEEIAEVEVQEGLVAPIIEPLDGTKFKSTLEVEIDTSNYSEDIQIYYKINPGKYQLYKYPFEINEDSTILAKAVKGSVSSEVSEVRYTLDPFLDEEDSDNIGYKCSVDSSSVDLSWDPDKKFKYYRLMIDRANNGITPFDIKSFDRDLILEDNKYKLNIPPGVEYLKWGIFGANIMDDLYIDFTQAENQEKILFGNKFMCGTKQDGFSIFLPEYTNKGKFIVEGSKGIETKIFINGEEVEYTSEIEWEKEIDLELGSNEIKIKVELDEVKTIENSYFVKYCEKGDFNCDGEVGIEDMPYYLFALNEYQDNKKIDIYSSTLVDLGGRNEDESDGEINIVDFILFQESYSNNR